jgi:hypothetical protein
MGRAAWEGSDRVEGRTNDCSNVATKPLAYSLEDKGGWVSRQR